MLNGPRAVPLTGSSITYPSRSDPRKIRPATAPGPYGYHRTANVLTCREPGASLATASSSSSSFGISALDAIAWHVSAEALCEGFHKPFPPERAPAPARAAEPSSSAASRAFGSSARRPAGEQSAAMGTHCGSGQPGSEKGWRLPSAPVRPGLAGSSCPAWWPGRGGVCWPAASAHCGRGSWRRNWMALGHASARANWSAAWSVMPGGSRPAGSRGIR